MIAVGDPHQSIYGWRGASADNLYAFSRAFARERAGDHVQPDDQLAQRPRHPRHRQPGLRAAAARGSTSRLEPAPRGGEHATCDSVHGRREADQVADWFAERGQHDAASVPVRAHTGAILFRSKRHMQTFAAAGADGIRTASSASAAAPLPGGGRRLDAPRRSTTPRRVPR
ncbi:UvrD-helicase domain-containing protein [Microbacterium sp.]|uniref:UvrD-helicase domain-containing protein n=1 Tax=Microbacterium sp. TaxID=51671 RepID=UPI003A927BB3